MDAIIEAPMTQQQVGSKFREAYENSPMRRLDIAKALAREIGYEKDPASLIPSIDDYLNGVRTPPPARAKALAKIMGDAGEAMLEDWEIDASQRAELRALIADARAQAANADLRRQEDIETLRGMLGTQSATIEGLTRRLRALERRAAPPAAESQ